MNNKSFYVVFVVCLVVGGIGLGVLLVKVFPPPRGRGGSGVTKKADAGSEEVEAEGESAADEIPTGTVTVKDPPEPKPLVDKKGLDLPDLDTMTVETDGSEMVFKMTFVKGLEGIVRAHAVGLKAGYIYVDIDNNNQSGGLLRGVERVIDLDMGLRYKGGGTMWGGGRPGKVIDAVLPSFSLMNVRTGESGSALWSRRVGTVQSNESDVRKLDYEENMKRVTMTAKVLTVRISYADLGIRPKDTVRFLVEERYGPSKGRWMPEFFLKVR